MIYTYIYKFPSRSSNGEFFTLLHSVIQPFTNIYAKSLSTVV